MEQGNRPYWKRYVANVASIHSQNPQGPNYFVHSVVIYDNVGQDLDGIWIGCHCAEKTSLKAIDAICQGEILET